MSVIVATDGEAAAPSQVSVSWAIASATPWAGPLNRLAVSDTLSASVSLANTPDSADTSSGWSSLAEYKSFTDTGGASGRSTRSVTAPSPVLATPSEAT